MMSAPRELLTTVNSAIQGLIANVPAALGCVVATVDGRVLEHYVTQDVDPQRMAAMVSAMVALGETIGREVRIDRSQYVVVSALKGTLLLQRVPSRKELLVVATLATTSTNLGVLLHETRRAAGLIGTALDDWLSRHPTGPRGL